MARPGNVPGRVLWLGLVPGLAVYGLGLAVYCPGLSGYWSWPGYLIVGKPVVSRQNSSQCALRVLSLLASKAVSEWVRIFDLRCLIMRFYD